MKEIDKQLYSASLVFSGLSEISPSGLLMKKDSLLVLKNIYKMH